MLITCIVTDGIHECLRSCEDLWVRRPRAIQSNIYCQYLEPVLLSSSRSFLLPALIRWLCCDLTVFTRRLQGCRTGLSQLKKAELLIHVKWNVNTVLTECFVLLGGTILEWSITTTDEGYKGQRLRLGDVCVRVCVHILWNHFHCASANAN